MTQTQQYSPFEVLKIRDFRNFFIARTCMVLGVNILGTAVGWQVYEITKDAFSLGMIGLAEFLPFVVVTLLGGYIADIFDRRKIILTCVFLYTLCALGLYFLTTKFSFLLDNQGVVAIFVLVGLIGLVRGFFGPAQSSFSSQLIPNQLFTNAATWSSMGWQLAAVGGPAIGGLLCAVSKGAWSSYLTAAILAFIGLVLFYSIDSRHAALQLSKNEDKNAQNTEGGQEEENTSTISGFLASVKEGLNFVFKNQILLGALALDMFAVLFGGAVALLPAFAKDILAVGPEGFGALRAAPAVGAVTMAGILAYYPPVKNAGKLLLMAVAGFGICTLLFALSTNFYFSLFLLAGTGFFDTVSMVIRGTIVQLFTPNEMRGRVSAVNSLFIGSSNELGAFESGAAARLMGLVPSVIFGGTMTLVVVAFAWLRAPILRGLDLRPK
ncbi:MAG: MFS transporter [Saprospiraceae bacterium]|nr:MFS transporter [Saprospiraceae bacterium]